MEALVNYDGEDFLCRYFFDIDNQEEGIEVYYLGNNKLIGTIYDLLLPDESVAEEVEDFNQAINMWLRMQDGNYLLG